MNNHKNVHHETVNRNFHLNFPLIVYINGIMRVIIYVQCPNEFHYKV